MSSVHFGRKPNRKRVCGSLYRSSQNHYGSEPNRTGTGQNHALKSFRLPCHIQRLELSVVHVVYRVLHCTVCTISSKGPLQAKSTCTRLTASGASETEKSHPRLPLNIGIWTAVRRTPWKDDIDRNSKLNNKITIIATEQTVVHHSIRHMALASMCWKRDFLWNH